jgi:hypothetical protein
MTEGDMHTTHGRHYSTYNIGPRLVEECMEEIEFSGDDGADNTGITVDGQDDPLAGWLRMNVLSC